MSFGEMIKAARLTKELTLRKLGVLISYPFSIISEIENGTRQMPDNEPLLKSLVSILEIDVGEAKKQIKLDKIQRNPTKLVNSLMNNDQFAAEFCRATEEMSEEKLRELILNAIKSRKEG